MKEVHEGCVVVFQADSARIFIQEHVIFVGRDWTLYAYVMIRAANIMASIQTHAGGQRVAAKAAR